MPVCLPLLCAPPPILIPLRRRRFARSIAIFNPNHLPSWPCVSSLRALGSPYDRLTCPPVRSPLLSPSTSSVPLTQAPQPTPPPVQQRGLFIAIEGLDRAGKSTQLSRLHAHLGGDTRTTLLKFPDRTTPIGKLLHSYLTTTAKEQPLDDRAVHLLFAANRWEVAARIRREVEVEGRVVLADRYAWSGVAYSRAKVSGRSNHVAQGMADISPSRTRAGPPPPLAFQSRARSPPPRRDPLPLPRPLNRSTTRRVRGGALRRARDAAPSAGELCRGGKGR